MNEITSKDFARIAGEYIAQPANWPAAMAARTLRIAAGHPAYSPTNQALILAQLVDRYSKNCDLEAALERAVDALEHEIAPRTIWAKRGFAPTGAPVSIWSKPVPLWLDDSGARVKPGTPGAIKRTVFRAERTYIAADVRNADGESGEIARVVPPMSDGDALEAFERLAAWITAQGWTVTRATRETAANGWTSHGAHRIAVHAGLDGWAAVETLAHEIAHAILHGDDDERDYHEHRGAIEAEAESVAFAVMMMAGQTELARGSVRYAVDWAGRDPKIVAAAYDRACYVTDALARVLMGETDVTVATSAKAEKLQAKASNKDLAAKLREAGVEPKGEAWARAKAGESLEAIAADFAKAA